MNGVRPGAVGPSRDQRLAFLFAASAASFISTFACSRRAFARAACPSMSKRLATWAAECPGVEASVQVVPRAHPPGSPSK